MTEIFGYKSTRERPLYCPKCGLGMEEVDEEADPEYNILGKRFKCTQCDFTRKTGESQGALALGS